MTDAESFLRTICQHPHDLAARLIYADWLTERGEVERSEFIRVQHELARLDGRCERGGGVSRWCEVDNRGGHHSDCPAEALRERELLIAWQRGGSCNWNLWHGLPGKWNCGNLLSDESPHRNDPTICYCRGFIEKVSLKLTDWLTHGKAIVQAAPILRVVVTDREPCDWHDGYGWYGVDRCEWTRATMLPHWLPSEVHRHLLSGECRHGSADLTEHGLKRVVVYPDAQSAQSALNTALIHHACHQAGWEL